MPEKLPEDLNLFSSHYVFSGQLRDPFLPLVSSHNDPLGPYDDAVLGVKVTKCQPVYPPLLYPGPVPANTPPCSLECWPHEGNKKEVAPESMEGGTKYQTKPEKLKG